jgi:hypothetical protein
MRPGLFFSLQQSSSIAKAFQAKSIALVQLWADDMYLLLPIAW